MKMKRTILAAFALIAGIATMNAAEPFRNLSFEEALKAAAAENKLLFIDCYADWCGPCKMMENEVFPQQAVIDYMNEKFVSIKIDMEKGEGPALAGRYGVSSYPTFLMLKPDGYVQHKMVGGRREPERFLADLAVTFDPAKATGDAEQLYKDGERSIEVLTKYFDIVRSRRDARLTAEVGAQIIRTHPQSEWTSAECWPMFQNPTVVAFGTEMFEYLFDNREEFKRNTAGHLVDAKIYSTLVAPSMSVIGNENSATTVEELCGVRDFIAANDIPNKALIADYTGLAIACLTEDYDGVISGLRKLAPGWSGIETSMCYPVPARKMFLNGTPAQKKEILEYTEEVAKGVHTVKSRKTMDTFLEELRGLN